jgi:hypothetical protein
MAELDIDGTGQCGECARKTEGKYFCLGCLKCSFCCTCDREISIRTCDNCHMQVTADMLCLSDGCGGCTFCCNHVQITEDKSSCECEHMVEASEVCLTCHKCPFCCNCSLSA